MWLIDDGPGLTDPTLVGHKFARQVLLAQDGFPVPPLVCVPATVFDLLLGGSDFTAASAGVLPHSDATLTAAAEQARKLVRDVALPVELLQILDGSFDGIAGGSGCVAVRACVVPPAGNDGAGEDSAEDPFAGMSDSFLYVQRAQLPQRLVDCWASAFNTEAVLYRARRGLDPFAARVAVGIQRMAMGARSFVAFTRDPRDGSRRCIIAAAHGIGEGVVQEKADVDHYIVDPASKAVLEAHVPVKTRAVGRDPQRPQDGPVAVPVDPRDATARVLTDAEVAAVTDLALRVARRFGQPQDIEGTITPDGLVHLVQARPIAHGPAPRTDVDDAATAQITWDNNNVTESFPGVSSALTFTVARNLYEVGFADLYRRMGVPARTARRNQHLLRRMIGHLNGRVYYQLDSWYRLHGQIRCFRPLWSTWEQSMGITAAADQRPRTRIRTWFTNIACTAEIAARMMAHPRRVRGFVRWWDGYHLRLSDTSSMRPHEAVTEFQLLWTEVARRWGVTLVNGLLLFAATWATKGLARRWIPDADSGVFNGMLCGGDGNRSAAAVRSAVHLASVAASSAEVSAKLTAAETSAQDARLLWEQVMADDAHEFAAAMRQHLRSYGDRAPHDLKLEARTPRDEPWMVLDTVRSYLRQRLDVPANDRTGADQRRQAARQLREQCRNPAKRLTLHVLFNAMRVLIRNREDTRFCRSQLFGDCRALLMRLGAELATQDRLDHQRDILDLTVDEVVGAFDGTLAGADLRGLAAVRAAERAGWEQAAALPARLRTAADLPVVCTLATAATKGAAEPSPAGARATTLRGLPSSSGTVRGVAAVVLDVSAPAERCRDKILVARETDPGWLYLMMSAKALIVERGTLLSHTAITGRLLGIPTVVAVERATTLIADGSLVEVDGAAGTVRILDGRP
ncbi:PEP/pyruvate-binding domain-containing protein [Dactylosporangium sp. NPDC005555]|uniref:PEP/pyruvate-binding domain-containing protein n=1 Tax=Dactylosporangium sp. NPDC005555 TaxID=3154889 RepID=UPI0033B2C26F